MESHSLMPSKESSCRQNVAYINAIADLRGRRSFRLEKLTCDQLYFRVF